MEFKDAVLDNSTTAGYRAPNPGGIPDNDTPEERSAFIDNFNHSPKSDSEKVYAFLNRFGTIKHDEFKRLTGIHLNAEKWLQAADDDGVMDLQKAYAFFDRGKPPTTASDKDRSDRLIDLKYDNSLLVYDKFRLFLDDHAYLTRAEFILLSGNIVDQKVWNQYAGKDGVMNPGEFDKFFNPHYGIAIPPADKGRTGGTAPAPPRTYDTPPGFAKNRGRSIYLSDLKDDNTLLTIDKLIEFVKRYKDITLEEFNYLSGEDVKPDEWRKYADDDGKMDADQYQKFSNAFFNIPKEMSYAEKSKRLQKVGNIKLNFNRGMYGKRENAFKAAIKELEYLTREEVEVLNGPKSYQTVADAEWKKMAGKDGELRAGEYDAWLERDKKVGNIKRDFNRGKYGNKRENAFKAAFKELGFLTRSEVEVLNGPYVEISNSEWKEMAGEDGVLSEQKYDAYGPDKAPLDRV